MSLLNKAIDMAVRNLDLAGAQYRIVRPDGQVISNIQETPVQARKKRQMLVKPGTYHAIYEPQLRDLPDGGLSVIKVPEGLDIELVRSSACCWASRNWGSKTYVSQVVGREIHFLRGANG